MVGFEGFVETMLFRYEGFVAKDSRSTGIMLDMVETTKIEARVNPNNTCSLGPKSFDTCTYTSSCMRLLIPPQGAMADGSIASPVPTH